MHHANPSSQCSLRSFECFEFLSFQPLEKPQLRSLQTSQLVPYGCSCKVFSGGPKFAFWIHMDSLCSKVCSVLGIWRPAGKPNADSVPALSKSRAAVPPKPGHPSQNMHRIAPTHLKFATDSLRRPALAARIGSFKCLVDEIRWANARSLLFFGW